MDSRGATDLLVHPRLGPKEGNLELLTIRVKQVADLQAQFGRGLALEFLLDLIRSTAHVIPITRDLEIVVLPDSTLAALVPLCALLDLD